MEFQNDIATLPLPLLPTKTMVQFVMEAIKQVPLVSLTDVTRQVASFYPVPLTTVSSISSTFHSTLSNCQEEANLTSPPLNTIKTTFNLTPPPPPSSPPFSFPFASHPLLVNTVTNESTLQTILSTTDPTVQHKILSLIQQAHSSTPWKQKKQNSSTSFSSNMDSLSSSILRTKIHENSTKQNHPHELHQNKYPKSSSRSASQSSSTSSLSSKLLYSLPLFVFSNFYPHFTSKGNSSVVLQPTLLDLHPKLKKEIQQILFQHFSEFMPITKKKLSLRKEKKLTPVVIISKPSSGSFSKKGAAPTTPLITPKKESKSPPRTTLTSSKTKMLTHSSPDISSPSSIAQSHVHSQNHLTVTSPTWFEEKKNLKKRKLLENYNDDSIQLSSTLLASPPTSTILLDSTHPNSNNVADESKISSLQRVLFPISSSHPNQDHEETVSTMKKNKKDLISPPTKMGKKKETQLTLLLDQLDQSQQTNATLDPIFFTSSVMSSLYLALSSKSIDLTLQQSHTLLTLAFKYLDTIQDLDLFLPLTSSSSSSTISNPLAILQELMDGMEMIPLIFSLFQLHSSLTKEALLSKLIHVLHDQIKKCILPYMALIEQQNYWDHFTSTTAHLSSGKLNHQKKSKSKESVDELKRITSTSYTQTSSLKNKIDVDGPIHKADIGMNENAYLSKDVMTLFKRFLYLLCNLIHQLHDFFMQHPVFVTDPIAISACYGVLYPLLSDVKVEDALMLRAMELVRLIFFTKPSLRMGILDEILSQLIHTVSSLSSSYGLDSKKSNTGGNLMTMHTSHSSGTRRQFKLMNGQHIHFFSALLLQLVQASLTTDAADLEACSNVCLQIVQYFISRATTKSVHKVDLTNESDYLFLVRQFTEDVFLVFNSPEFPCTELMCRTLLQQLLVYMEEEKGSSDLPMKAWIMEVFATLLSKLHAFQPVSFSIHSSQVKNSQDIIAKYFALACQWDPALKHAYHYVQVEWKMLNNLHPTSSSSSTLPLDKEKMDVDVDLERDELNMDTHHSDVMKTPTFASAATTSTSSTTPVDEPLVPLSNQPLHSIDDVTVDRATCVSHLTLLFPYRLLYQQRDPLLLRSLAWFESKDIYLRSRAIRILSQTIEVQPSIMHRPHVEKAIQARLLDSSPSVRDGVLEALGKWLLKCHLKTDATSKTSKHPLSPFYFDILVARVLDKATSVRKRALKTLAQLHPQLTLDQQTQTILKCLGRFQDEEESIVKLSRKLLGNLLIPSLPSLSASTTSSSSSSSWNITSSVSLTTLSISEQCILTHHTQLLSGLVQLLPSSDTLVTYLAEHLPPSSTYGLMAMTLSLFHQLTHQPTSLALYTAFYVILQAYPSWMTLDMFMYFSSQLHQSMTSPPPSSTPQAFPLQGLQLSLLHLYLQEKPNVPKKELETLEIHVCKLILAGTQLMHVHTAVQVLCELAQLSQNTTRLMKLKKNSDQAFQSSLLNPFPSPTSTFHRVLVILATLYGYPTLWPGKEIQSFLNQVYSLFHTLVPWTSIHTTAVTCLGWIWMASPSLILKTHALKYMKQWVQWQPSLNEVHLMMMESVVDFFYSFLVREDQLTVNKKESLKLENGNPFDRKAFHGLSDDVTHSGISESLAQSLVTDLVTCTLQLSILNKLKLVEKIQKVLGFIAIHRLVHPKFVMPAVITLSSTCSSNYLAAVARSQHAKLHAQHRSILYDHMKESIVTTYQYQRACHMDQGFVMNPGQPPTALFHPWFQLLESHKKDRHHFLVHCLSFFTNFHPSFLKVSILEESMDLNFFSWLAEQLFWLDYTSEEDVLLLLRSIHVFVLEHSTSIQEEFSMHCTSPLVEEREVWEVAGPPLRLLLMLQLHQYLIQTFRLKKNSWLSTHSSTLSSSRHTPKTSSRTKHIHRVSNDPFLYPFYRPHSSISLNSGDPNDARKGNEICRVTLKSQLDQSLTKLEEIIHALGDPSSTTTTTTTTSTATTTEESCITSTTDVEGVDDEDGEKNSEEEKKSVVKNEHVNGIEKRDRNRSGRSIERTRK